MMVVYQQLYAPYEVYVRPLEMFMSRTDTRKYPEERQVYRFEKLDISGGEETIGQRQPDTVISGTATTVSRTEAIEDESAGAEEKFALDAGLVAFLDADSYEKKLQILSSLHPRITDAMIDTMAASLDTEVKAGDIESRYNEIKSCLLTMERFECNRLRQ